MRNVNGEELYDYMALLACGDVRSLGSMPASMGDPMLARMRDGDYYQRCAECGWRRRDIGGPHRNAPDPWQPVIFAGLWDWARIEAFRDERRAEEHARSLGHAMGWCCCAPADDDGPARLLEGRP